MGSVNPVGLVRTRKPTRPALEAPHTAVHVIGFGSRMPRTMEDIMSPRLDGSRTQEATSTLLRNIWIPSSTMTRSSTTTAHSPGFRTSPLTTRLLRRTPGPVQDPLRAARVAGGRRTHEHAYVRNTLVELNLALVKFAASRFRSRSEPMEDIIQVGTIGLIKAIDRFEMSRGVEFPHVRDADHHRRDQALLPRLLVVRERVPRRLQELRLDLAKAGDELAQRLDRAPHGERAGRAPRPVQGRGRRGHGGLQRLPPPPRWTPSRRRTTRRARWPTASATRTTDSKASSTSSR